MLDSRLTIIDIAREAGVSSATVSRVLSKHPNVSALTASRVRAVVDKYGYQPNSIARGLQQRQSHVLGIIMPDIKHPYYAGIFSAAQREAEGAGSVVQLYRLEYNGSVTEEFIRRLIERRLDGTLLTGGFIESPNARELPIVLDRLRQYMPIVTIGPEIPGFECARVWPDLPNGVRRAVDLLAELGHKRIAFIGATTDTRSVGEREQGFREGCERLGIEAILYNESIHNPAKGEESAVRLLDGLPRNRWPTAVMVINDLMALGVLKGLRTLGLTVPDDMAVVGCDNQFFSAFTDPPLTTLNLNAEELGRLAMRQLIGGTGDLSVNAPEPIVVDPGLIIRESCGTRRRMAQMLAAEPALEAV
ncbi:MAG: LacI family transcriptional regulator [Oscillospiraceae bacterium]|jgi:DNA-binding LacI/PurR family transcriptional regulator|nr:LacI family transcriptional regulator [Oscillospiraceae bacterium]